MSVTETLDSAGIGYVVHTHVPIRGEADLALITLSWETSVKTLAFGLPDGRLALVAVPGPARVLYGEIAKALGVPRSALRQADEAELAEIGMEPGGVSPLTTADHVVVVVDAAVPGMGLVYCGGGNPTTTVEVDASAILQLARTHVIATVTR